MTLHMCSASFKERSPVARKLVVGELKERRIQADRNRLLTVGLREDLTQMETMQLLWEIRDVGGADEDLEIVVME